MQWNEYLESHKEVFEEINLIDLDKILDILQKVRESSSTLWVVGNGGSAATASHIVADFGKTSTALGQKSVRAIALSELVSLSTAFANDISFESAFSESIKLLAKPTDALLLISVSGTSPNLLGAHEAAKALGLRTISLTGIRGIKVAEQSDASVVVQSDDYQVVENTHVFIAHWLVKELS